MSNPLQLAALVLCVIPLGACDGDDKAISKFMAEIRGETAAYQSEIARLKQDGTNTEAELAALRAQYQALAGIPPQQPQTPATDVPSPPVIDERDLPCNEGEGQFRVWHCEGGVRSYP